MEGFLLQRMFLSHRADTGSTNGEAMSSVLGFVWDYKQETSSLCVSSGHMIYK